MWAKPHIYFSVDFWYRRPTIGIYPTILYKPSIPPSQVETNRKGTASAISSEPPCKDGNVRFTKVLLKPLSDLYFGKGCRFCNSKVFISDKSFI